MIDLKLLRRCFHFFAYHLYVKRKISRNDRVEMFGFAISVPPTVFHPVLFFTSKFIGSYVQELDLADKHVLDMGCGSGILSLIAASKGASVTSIDINSYAVTATKDNADANRLQDRISVHEGNLFDGCSSSERFDYIFFNPPFYSGTPSHSAQYAWKAGENFEVLRSFGSQARARIQQGGSILMILSTDTDYQHIVSLIEADRYTLSIVRTKRVLFERLFIYRIVPNS